MQSIPPAPLPERRSLLRQWRKVYGPRGKRPFRFVCFSPNVTAVFVHFDQRIMRHVPCVGENACTYCIDSQTRRWMGYVAGARCDTHEICIAEVTEGAARRLIDLGLLPGKLRAQVVTLYREKDHKNAPVMVKAEKHSKPSNIPEDFDPMPHLLRMWGWNDDNRDAVAAKVDKPIGPGGGLAAHSIASRIGVMK